MNGKRQEMKTMGRLHGDIFSGTISDNSIQLSQWSNTTRNATNKINKFDVMIDKTDYWHHQ
jgi:hypothetical protein